MTTEKAIAPDKAEDLWTKISSRQLLGRKIVAVRYMSEAEASDLGWYHRPVVIQLDDGNLVYPSVDAEGNDAGTLFTNDEASPVLPVLPKGGK